jgi:hypothetical protein
MTPKIAKVALTVFVLASAFGGLLWYSVQEDAAFYKRVDG